MDVDFFAKSAHRNVSATLQLAVPYLAFCLLPCPQFTRVEGFQPVIFPHCSDFHVVFNFTFYYCPLPALVSFLEDDSDAWLGEDRVNLSLPNVLMPLFASL